MARVYPGPVRFLFKGNQELSKKYTTIGRKFLDMAIERSGGQKVNWTRVLPNKTIIHVYSWGSNGYNILIDTTYETLEEGLTVLSGVFIEPTSDDAPSGWGPPKTEIFPVGTPGETPIGTVINNNPDDPYIKRTLAYGGDDYEGIVPSYILDWSIPNDLGYLTWRATNAITNFFTSTYTAGLFHRYLCTPIGTEIFIYNTLLCEIPEETITGCGIQVVDNVKYLYAIIHKNNLQLKIIRRIFASSYINDDPLSTTNPLGWEDVSDWISVGASQGYTTSEIYLSSGAYFSEDGTDIAITLATKYNFIRSPIGMLEINVDGLIYSFNYSIIEKTEYELDVSNIDDGTLNTPYRKTHHSYSDYDYECPWGDGVNSWTYSDQNDDGYAVFNPVSSGGDPALDYTERKYYQNEDVYALNRSTVLGADYVGNTLKTITRDISDYIDMDNRVAKASGTYDISFTEYCSICYPSSPYSGSRVYRHIDANEIWEAYSSSGTDANVTITYDGTSLPITGTYIETRYGVYTGGLQTMGKVHYTETTVQLAYEKNYCSVGSETTSTTSNTATQNINDYLFSTSENYIIYIDLRYETPPIILNYTVTTTDSSELYPEGTVTLSIGSTILFTEAVIGNSLYIDNGNLYPGISAPATPNTTNSYKSVVGLHTINPNFSVFHRTNAIIDKYGYIYIEFPDFIQDNDGDPTYEFNSYSYDYDNMTQYTNYTDMGFDVFTKLGYYGDSPKFNTLLLV